MPLAPDRSPSVAKGRMPESDSATAKFLREFDPQGDPDNVWDTLLSLVVDLSLKAGVIDSDVPGVG
jgi:hypothetical protein